MMRRGERRGWARGALVTGTVLVMGVAAACEAGPPERLPERTPLEANGFDRLTTHQEVADFVGFLEVSERVEVHELGASVTGREIPYLKVSSGTFGEDSDKVRALFFAQQHGNEPSGKEGALALALELARGEHDDLLEHVDLLLVPQVNPDGAEEHRRRNEEGTDLNRSHLVLDGPEVEAVRELFHRWEPEVAVDVHQYYPWSSSWLDEDEGWLRLFDMQVGLPTNLNTDPGIRRLAEEGFLPHAEEAMTEAGFTFHNYLVGSPDYLRWSTSNINDGRQGFAILNTLSFIFEGKRSEPEARDIERRAEAQRRVMESLLRFSAEHREEVLTTVRGARERLTAGEVDELVLVMDREGDGGPLEIPVERVTYREEVDGEAERPEDAWALADTVTASIDEWYPEVVPVETVEVPAAYLVDGDQGALIRLLERHGVEMEVLEEAARFPGERLRVTGRRAMEIKGDEWPLPEVAGEAGSVEADPGDVIVPTAQLRGLMVATALEPGSMHGLWNYEEFEHLGEEGTYPVTRLEEVSAQ